MLNQITTTIKKTATNAATAIRPFLIMGPVYHRTVPDAIGMFTRSTRCVHTPEIRTYD